MNPINNQSMKVIFLEEVRNVAKKFDVKDVSNGYARNFLFPNKLAEPATPSAMKKLEALKAEHDKNEAELLRRLREIAEKINETKIEFTVKDGQIRRRVRLGQQGIDPESASRTSNWSRRNAWTST